MNLDTAIEAHSQWKVKLRSAINAQEKLDPATIGADNQCPFGKWLHGEGKSKYGMLKSHAQCLERHAAFHREAGKVATAISAGRYAEAEKMLAGGTPYAAASTAVGGAILGLKKEAAL